MINFGPRIFPVLLFVGILSLPACHSDQPVEALAGRFLSGYQEAFPAPQAQLVFSSLPARLDSIGKFRGLLAAIDTHYLSQKGKIKRQKLDMRLQAEWNRWEPYRTDPSLYNLGGLLKKSLTGSVGRPDRERLQELLEIMDRAQPYYSAARQNLLVADVNLYRLAAQKQYLGLEFLRGELQDSLRSLSLSAAERAACSRKVRGAELALKDYMGFCESVYLNYRDSTYYDQ